MEKLLTALALIPPLGGPNAVWEKVAHMLFEKEIAEVRLHVFRYAYHQRIEDDPEFREYTA